MAKTPTMIDCPACGHHVSSTAMSCPSCGAVLRKPKRGFFGKIIIALFWLFNLFMAFWLWGGSNAALEKSKGLTGAEQVGATIGTGLGVTMILVLWVIGAAILGLMALLTRPKA